MSNIGQEGKVDKELKRLIVAYGRAMVGKGKATTMAAIETYCDSRNAPVEAAQEPVQCTIAEYAAGIGSYPRAVLRMIERGELQAKKFGRTWVIIT